MYPKAVSSELTFLTKIFKQYFKNIVVPFLIMMTMMIMMMMMNYMIDQRKPSREIFSHDTCQRYSRLRNLWNGVSRVWTYKEPEFRPNWIKRNSDNHYTSAPHWLSDHNCHDFPCLEISRFYNNIILDLLSLLLERKGLKSLFL